MPFFSRRMRRRRRPFGRPRLRAGGRALRELQAAHKLLRSGRHSAAADIFEELASLAEARAPQRAPQLHFQAGRARLEAGQVPTALNHLRRGLHLLALGGAAERLAATAARVIAGLRQHGLQDEAEELERELAAPPFELAIGEFEPEVRRSRPDLRPNCPACGAVARPDEVEWIEHATALCAYCGSIIPPTSSAE